MSTEEEIIKVFGNRLRLRVCGICIQNDKILLAKHISIGDKGIFWAPPGGGLDFGESAATTLIREFKEETGLEVEIKKFICVNEFISPPLHGIELFFEVSVKSGTLQLGSDPEMSKVNQIIKEVKFVSYDEIKSQSPELFHHLLNISSSTSELMNLKGYYKYEKN